MTTSILAENTITQKMASNFVNHFSENTTYDPVAGLDKLLKQLADEIARQTQLADEIAKEEPIYDVPRKEEPIYDVPRVVKSYDPTYDYPRAITSHDDIPRSVESNSEVPKALARRPLPPIPVEPSVGNEPIYAKISAKTKTSAKRPLPPIPVEPAMVNEPIYAEISSSKKPKNSVKIKTSLHQAKIHLLESLQRCVHSLSKIFSAIRSNQSNDTIKTLQDTINADPVMDEKLALSLAEFKYATLGSSESLQELIQHLKNVIFVLEGRVAASMKVFGSVEYGDILGDKLLQPIAQARLDLDQATARLAEVKGLEKELASTNSESMQTLASAANNRFALFGRTASASEKMVENPLYDSIEVIKGMTRSAN